MTAIYGRICLGIVTLIVTLSALPALAQNAVTGPSTEKRFPPLKLGGGFEATLFACDPLVEYPSVIALGPKPGTLFVAHDYMTGLGREIVKRDEIRLIEDTDGDGYADKSTLFAGGFNSIQGLAYDIGGGTVFAMHAPYLTMVRDTDGDGVADERRDLLEGLGLPPEENDTRLHTANGVTIGHDGWLYLALGDHGAKVERPEGGQLVLEGGGILRCRPDGTELHVFSTGLRNIYDVALDADLNVFVRDNENDGGDYKIRVYHSFFGADHGYPYKYDERPEETMLPLADLDLGSSAGGVCYLETALPKKYRGNLFFCDWNHSLVRYEVRPKGASFEPMEEFKVAEGGEGDLYPFRPSDVIVDWDGTLLVSDWADGQRPKRGRGRIYRFTHRDAEFVPVADPEEDLSTWSPDDLMGRMDSDSYYARVLAQHELAGRELKAIDSVDFRNAGARSRRHALWILARSRSRYVTEKLTALATDFEVGPEARAGAVRALVDRLDPLLEGRRPTPESDAPDFPKMLADLPQYGDDPGTLLELIIGLGRLQWDGSAQWGRSFAKLRTTDPAIAHASMQAMKQSGNWPEILKMLDRLPSDPFRVLALRALADEPEAVIVDDLLDRLLTDRSEYVDLLARVHRKPGPWVYWEYRPAPRPANTVDWERTSEIEEALNRVIAQSRDTGLRRFTLERMRRENIPVTTAGLAKWLKRERDAKSVALILGSLGEKPADEATPLLEAIIRDSNHAEANRLIALELIPVGVDFPAIVESLEDGPVLASALLRAGRRSKTDLTSQLFEKIESPNELVRAAAITVLGEHRNTDAADSVLKLLSDPDPGVREAAATAAQKIPVSSAADRLLELAADDRSPAVRRECFDALRAIGNGGAIAAAIRDLKTRETQLAALRYLNAFGNPEHAAAVIEAAGSNRSHELLESAVGALEKWNCGEDIARLQGRSGVFLRWFFSESEGLDSKTAFPEELGREPVIQPSWKSALATGPDSIVRAEIPAGSSRFFLSDVSATDETPIQFIAGCGSPFKLWLNGNPVFEHSKAATFQSDAHRFNAVLKPGNNRVVVQIQSVPEKVKFTLKFRRRSSVAAREELTQAALTGRGNAERGRKLFFNRERSQCLACHRLGDEGGKIGPELTGMGGRFSRIYLVESILDPNANVTPGFKTLSLKKKDGTALLGVKVSETDTVIILGDAAGQPHEIPKSDIAEIKEPNISLMPAGLENLYSRQEFLDLMAFLISEK